MKDSDTLISQLLVGIHRGTKRHHIHSKHSNLALVINISSVNEDAQTLLNAGDRPALAAEQHALCPAEIDKSFLGHESGKPIAAIGYSIRFPPEATSSDAFWRMLKESRSARTEIPGDRFDVEVFYHSDSTRH